MVKKFRIPGTPVVLHPGVENSDEHQRRTPAEEGRDWDTGTLGRALRSPPVLDRWPGGGLRFGRGSGTV